MLQQLVVWFYTLLHLLKRNGSRLRWLAIILVAVFIFLRSSPVKQQKPKKVHINKVDTTVKNRGDLISPTPIQQAWAHDEFECVGWQRLHTCKKPEEKENKGREDEKARVIALQELADGNDGEMGVKAPKPALIIREDAERQFLNCSEHIQPQMAGHCVVRNRTSGEYFNLMVTDCDSLPSGHFTCDMAANFSEYGLRSVEYEHEPTALSLAVPAPDKTPPVDGILMVVYEKVLPSAYATIRMLRVQGCDLPVEMWYRPDEMQVDSPIIHELLAHYNVRLRSIFDDRAKGFHVKPFAVYYSNFDRVLLLDADNLPARDPTYLFDDPEFVRTGALFWPDFWQPSNSLFKLTNTSLMWELTGVSPIEMFEQESGQVLIDRQMSRKALNKLMFYSAYQPRMMEELHLIWGDKDLFRLAWLNTSTPFHMVSYPPAVGGFDLRATKGIFCGAAMIQHDVQGNLVFFHRNGVKLTGDKGQPQIITHIQEYALEGDPKDFRIYQAVYAWKECCYYIGTERLPDGRPAAQITPTAQTEYASIEELAIDFSMEAKRLLQKRKRSTYLTIGKKEIVEVGAQMALAIIIGAMTVGMIFLVWCLGSPMRERLPSRWKGVETSSKER